MHITINQPPADDAESVWYGETVVIDRAGVDIIFSDGRRVSGNWGNSYANEVGEVLIIDDFQESDYDTRKDILDSLRVLVGFLEDYVD